MSDKLTWLEQLKIKYKIQLSGDYSCLRYVGYQRSGQCVALKISMMVLLKWRELKTRFPDISYQQLLELSAFKLPIKIKPGVDRIEESLRVMASQAFTKSRGLRGLTRKNFLEKTRSYHVFMDELLDVSSLEKDFKKLEEENKNLREQLQDLDSRCDELFQELLKEKDKVKTVEMERDYAFQENQELKEYLDFIEETTVCTSCSSNLQNTGQPVEKVGERQKRRKVKELKTRSERALWFMESFGFKLDSIKIEDLDGKVTEINYSENCSRKTNFQHLPENEKTTIRALLYIMDTCCIGDSAYHEMSMLVDGLPRSYLIKQCRNELNSISHITRTPGKHPGAQMSFKAELKEQIRKKVIFFITVCWQTEYTCYEYHNLHNYLYTII
jgi:hypothetical protein